MNIWNKYITSVRTKIQVKQDKKLLTERQGKLKHFVKINDKCGKYLWINAYCPSKELYLWDEEVRPMTEKELTNYRTEEKEKRAAQAKRRELKAEYKKRQEIGQSVSVRNIMSTLKENEIIIVDTETTGLDSVTDELLQVSIIDSQGNTLFNSYIKPLFTENWDGAMAVNHITPEMVANAPNIFEVKQEINRILNSANIIVGYNTNLDLSFLSAVGIENSNAIIVDVMILFAEIYGEWSEIHNDYKWQKLTKCAEYYCYDWSSETAHDSLADCKATLYCYKKIQEQKMK
jgi:DNA polymerase-3 subunit epsilon